MRRVSTVVGSLAASALLVLTLPASSQAAAGVFTYTVANGGPQSISNPVDGHCYNTDGATAAGNNTNREARLYASAGCMGTAVATLNPFASVSTTDFSSVTFAR